MEGKYNIQRCTCIVRLCDSWPARCATSSTQLPCSEMNSFSAPEASVELSGAACRRGVWMNGRVDAWLPCPTFSPSRFAAGWPEMEPPRRSASTLVSLQFRNNGRNNTEPHLKRTKTLPSASLSRYTVELSGAWRSSTSTHHCVTFASEAPMDQ